MLHCCITGDCVAVIFLAHVHNSHMANKHAVAFLVSGYTRQLLVDSSKSGLNYSLFLGAFEFGTVLETKQMGEGYWNKWWEAEWAEERNEALQEMDEERKPNWNKRETGEKGEGTGWVNWEWTKRWESRWEFHDERGSSHYRYDDAWEEHWPSSSWNENRHGERPKEEPWKDVVPKGRDSRQGARGLRSRLARKDRRAGIQRKPDWEKKDQGPMKVGSRKWLKTLCPAGQKQL